MAITGEEWEVEYSRFFNFPLPSPHSSPLKPLPPVKSRQGGVWITASSLTALRVRSPVLSVSVPGAVYEEHCISKLNITLPQLSCASESSSGVNRVVFLSFRDCSQRVHKFAVRFCTSSDIQAFRKYVKETSRDIKLGISDLRCGSSSPVCETASSVNPHIRAKKSKARKSTILALSANAQQNALQTPIASSQGGLPPSFSDFLSSCSIKTSKASSLVKPIPEVSVNKGNTKHASQASFHDMLAKMEGVIAVLGDDMSL